MRYEPVELPISIEAGLSDLMALRYSPDGLVVEFAVPNVEVAVLRVSFSKVEIFRVLDEMYLSTEGDQTVGAWEGHRPDHLAYRMHGAHFGRLQSELLEAMSPNAAHYMFVTGSDCLDVISDVEPVFQVIRLGG
jgi:hypothetical protein